MTYQADIQREFFQILAVRQRRLDYCSPAPRLNMQAMQALTPSLRDFEAAYSDGNASGMRTAIMNLAVEAMLVRYSLDDALI